MAGIDEATGHVLDGFPHVEQSLGKIFSTRQGERVMREWFGNPGLQLLGKNCNEHTILLFFNVLWMLVELFEPRFKVIQFRPNDVNRLGFSDFTINGQHRPYAHLDWQQSAMFVSIDGSTVSVRPAL